MRHIREINTAVTRAIKKLAPTRTYQILPQRIQEWSLTPFRAEENEKKRIRKKFLAAKQTAGSSGRAGS
ncbi:putative PHD finger and CXXC domain-containing protein [Daphnia magna]|uniref:Putative PHD finger and CXXC domain-containing protein n=1 Tax=Daphnia magna TaxID=35525 RepID=A0A0P5YM14_9CRUS|nr:putative PHD finger and CXXC domain-containing protein [Daphnia magna]